MKTSTTTTTERYISGWRDEWECDPVYATMTPMGGDQWTASTVKTILHNEIYKGEAWVNRYETFRTENGKKGTRLKPREEWTLLPDVAPALVSEAVQDMAQAALLKKKQNVVRTNSQS